MVWSCHWSKATGIHLLPVVSLAEVGTISCFIDPIKLTV